MYSSSIRKVAIALALLFAADAAFADDVISYNSTRGGKKASCFYSEPNFGNTRFCVSAGNSVAFPSSPIRSLRLYNEARITDCDEEIFGGSCWNYVPGEDDFEYVIEDFIVDGFYDDIDGGDIGSLEVYEWFLQ